MLSRVDRHRCSRRVGKRFSLRVESLEDRSLLSFTPFALFPGNPITPGTPDMFSGVGTAGVTAAITSFQNNVGGADNGNTASPQATGSRSINWDAVKLDGTDFGGGANTTVIAPNSTVGIPQNRFQTRGIFFDTVYAVSSDGFSTVNTNAAGLFPAFSPKNTFAMFNDNTIDFSFVTPSPTGTAASQAASRGFGAVFLNVEKPNTTSIEYFAGPKSLGKVFVAAGTKGQAEFAGELFANPIVTNVTITLGTDALFQFDGNTFKPGGTDDPANGKNLAVTDDFFYAEPRPIADAAAVLDGSQGTNAATAKVSTQVAAPFTGTVATFSSANPAATAKDFFAVINWGDNHLTNGTIKANAQGGFDVSGTNTYSSAGLFPVAVTAYDFGGSQLTITNTAQVSKAVTQIALTSSSNPAITGQSIVFTAAVTAPSGGAVPTGNVTFLDGTAALGTATLDSSGMAKLTTSLSPGSHSITAVYNGDTASATSTSTAVTQAVTSDVTSILTAQFGTKKKRKGKFTQSVTISNFGSNPIVGPLFLVLTDLTTGTSLSNATGKTQTFAPVGSPVLSLGSGGLGVGKSITMNLLFTGRKIKFSFNPHLLAGVAQP